MQTNGTVLHRKTSSRAALFYTSEKKTLPNKDKLGHYFSIVYYYFLFIFNAYYKIT